MSVAFATLAVSTWRSEMDARPMWIVALAALLACSCGGDDDSTVEPTADTSAAVATEPPATDVPTTAESTEVDREEPVEVEPPDFVVVFPGEEAGCSVSGPSEVVEGDYVFVYRDDSGNDAVLLVGRLLDDHTYDDLLMDMAARPTGHAPDWVLFVYPREIASREYNRDADLADGEIGRIFRLSPGVHGIWVWQQTSYRVAPCAPLDVTEAAN